MWGFQAAGAAPIVLGHPVANPETIATAIRIGNPASWVPALEVIHESFGDIRAVTDDEIIDAYQYLARNESIFCEPASAASVAGLLKFGVPKGQTVVCVLTGNGLKDPDTAVSTSQSPTLVDATIKALLGESGLDRLQQRCCRLHCRCRPRPASRRRAEIFPRRHFLIFFSVLLNLCERRERNTNGCKALPRPVGSRVQNS